MAKRPAPPSGVPRRPASAPAAPASPQRAERKGAPTTTASSSSTQRRADVGGWLGGIRLSGFMVIMLCLVVLAAVTLVPTIGNFVQQRQRIAALEHQVQLTQQEVDELKEQRERLNDPAYITTQARERLYYVHPGEVMFLVVNDLPADAQPHAEQQVSADVTKTRSDWMTQMLASLGQAGLARTASTDATTPEPAAPTPTP